MKYAFILTHRKIFPIKLMCSTLQVSSSGFRSWKEKQSQSEAKKNNLLRTVKKIFLGSRKTYGSPRILAQLKGLGFKVSKSTVERIMRKNAFVARKKKKIKQTTDSKHQEPIAPNVLDRNFFHDKPNQAWMADITYIATRQGWLYLAAVMDSCTRKIVGWKLSQRMKADLVCDALKMALNREKVSFGLIHHSDRGSQYASKQFRQLLWKHKITQSMSRKGNCWDNAPMESFFDTIKSEFIYHEEFNNRQEAISKIFEWIEVFYNRQRIHSALGYKTPVCFYEEKMRQVA